MSVQNGKMKNLTEGPLVKQIFQFILPIMIMNLLQNLYNAADMAVVGYSGVPGALGAIGTTAAMNNFFLNIFIGFSVGANIMVSRHVGAGNERATREAVHTALCVNAVVGVLIGGTAFLLAPSLLRLIGDEGDVLRLASSYSRIVFCGSLFISLGNCCINIFRGKGDSKTPMFVMTGSGLLNVGLNFFFVLVCGMSVEGVALATVISQFCSAAVMIWLLHRDDGWTHLDFKALKITKGSLHNQLSMGIPSAIQGCLFSLSNMLIQSSLVSLNNQYYPGGSAIIDGNAAGSSLESFLYTCSFSCNQAAVTFASQHVGAGKYSRMRRVRRSCLIIGSSLSMSLAVIMLLFKQDFVSIYVTEPHAMEAAFVRMRIMFSSYFCLAAMETVSGFLRGLGRSLLSTVNSLIGACLFRVIWISFVFSAWPSLETIYISYPISWALTAILSFLAGEKTLRGMEKKYGAEKTA